MSENDMSEKIAKSLTDIFKKTITYKKMEITVNIASFVGLICSLNLLYNYYHYSKISTIEHNVEKYYKINNYDLNRKHYDTIANYKLINSNISKHDDVLLSLLTLNQSLFLDYRNIIKELTLVKNELNIIRNLLETDTENNINTGNKIITPIITSEELLNLTSDSIPDPSPTNISITSSNFMLSDDELYAECYKAVSSKNTAFQNII
jgi:hypothetical protein